MYCYMVMVNERRQANWRDENIQNCTKNIFLVILMKN